MSENLEQILNECLDHLMLRGGTVEDCLAAYPQDAVKLEPYLRIAARYAASFRQAPSEEAKALGRQRMQAELQALRQAQDARRPALSFDEALDQSISRIQRGESVEACLSAYPQHAEELRPHLRIAAFATQSAAIPIDAKVKAAGGQRLQAELQALREQQSPHFIGRSPWLSLAFALQQRWAMTMVTAAFAILIGGFGLVQASDGALPGETLYSLKQAAEEARLALDFSPDAKAERYLAYAERRGVELGLLIQQGRQERLAVTRAALDQHVASATAIATGQEKPGAVADLQTKIERSASKVLAELQDSVQNAPTAVKEQARESFKAVGQS